MAKKPLSDLVCQRRLTKYIEERYTEEEQEIIDYYNDIIKEHTYAFDYELNKRRHLLQIDRTTGKITNMEVTK